MVKVFRDAAVYFDSWCSQRFVGYFVAVVSVLVTIFLRALLAPYLTVETPLLLFLGPVIISALFCGVGPGILATLLGCFCDTYYFLYDSHTLQDIHLHDLVSAMVFITEGFMISLLGGFHREYKTRLTRSLKKTSEALKEREAADSRARELEAKLAKVWRLNTLGEMASGFAHELGQPITAINNYATVIMRTDGWNLSVPARESLREITKETQRAASFVQNLRGFIKGGKPSQSKENFNEVVQDVLAIVKHEAASHEVTIKADFCKSAPIVFADPIQIGQVVLNLVRNAIECLSSTEVSRRKIWIETSLHENKYVQLKVRDQGQGIPSGNLDKIFEAFFTTKTGGLGMGLAISRRIVEAHAGQLTVSSDANVGTQFVVRLPKAI